MMIKRLKKGIIPIFLAVICGSVCGKLVCDIYASSIANNMDIPMIYLIQAGSYSSYDNMVDNTNVSNYIYYEDDGKYKPIVGITLDSDNISKIKSVYDGDTTISEYYSDDNNLNKKIKEYDKKIGNTDDVAEIKNIVLEMIDLYKDSDKNTLIRIS